MYWFNLLDCTICSYGEEHTWTEGIHSYRKAKSISIVCCCPRSHALHTNLTLLANKLITVCDLCPLPLLNPLLPPPLPPPVRLRADGIVWGRVYFYTAVLSLKLALFFSHYLILHFFSLSLSSYPLGFMPSSHIILMFGVFTVNQTVCS